MVRDAFVNGMDVSLGVAAAIAGAGRVLLTLAFLPGQASRSAVPRRQRCRRVGRSWAMTSSSADDAGPTPLAQIPGLRERKKARTRAAIQGHALRLFREQGYDATTVEQIAEAVEISSSTFFRYFPTKEDVVLYDDFDPLLFAAFEVQPAELSPIQAMRRALRQVFASVPAAEAEQQWERGRLILAVPELRMRMLDQLAEAVQLSAEMIAKRVGRRADDPDVLTFTGALGGALLAAMFANINTLQENYAGVIDSALAYLEAGMPL